MAQRLGPAALRGAPLDRSRRGRDRRSCASVRMIRAAAALAGALIAFCDGCRALERHDRRRRLRRSSCSASRRRGRAWYTRRVRRHCGSIAAVFWSRGYASFKNKPSDQAPHGLFSWHYLSARGGIRRSSTGRLLLILLPLAAARRLRAPQRAPRAWLPRRHRGRDRVFYSAYYITALHPRFLFVALPPLFVLIAAGVAKIMRDEREQAPKAP